MEPKRIAWEIVHTYIIHDLIGPFSKMKYGKFGKKSRLFKPLIADKHKRNIRIGNNTYISKYSRIQCYSNPNNEKIGQLQIGNNCRILYRVSFLCGEDIELEDGVLVASDVLITSENHQINPELDCYYMSQQLICKKVLIKEGSWIGEKVCILPGVTIGKKCIIGAGSVVTRSIPDYCIAVGNPAKVIKQYDFNSHKWIVV